MIQDQFSTMQKSAKVEATKTIYPRSQIAHWPKFSSTSMRSCGSFGQPCEASSASRVFPIQRAISSAVVCSMGSRMHSSLGKTQRRWW